MAEKRKYPSGAQRRKTGGMTAPQKARQGLSRVRIKDKHGLIPQHRAFLEAYVTEADFDLLKAADIIGLHPSKPRSVRINQANAILKRPEVRALMHEWIETDPLVVSRHERLRLLSRISRGDLTETRYTREGDTYEAAPSIDQRMRALELLGKAQGDALTINVHVNPETMSELEILAALAALGTDIAQLTDGTIDTSGEDVTGRVGEDTGTFAGDDQDTSLPDVQPDTEPQ